MEKKKDKTKKKEETKKKKTRKKTTNKSINEKIRDVIHGKKPLTRNQVLQVLSGIIDGDIKDDLTKMPAGIQDKITASKLILEEYRKQDEDKRKALEKTGVETQLEEKITKENEALIAALSNRVIKGVDDEEIESEEKEPKEDIEDALQS